MNKRCKNYFAIILAVILFCVSYIIVLHIANNEIDSLVENKIITEMYSPNEKYRAVIIDNSGGATTGFSYQLVIAKKNEKIKRKDENIVFISDRKFEILWLDDNNLSVKKSDGEVFKKEKQYKEVYVHYE